MNSSTRTFIPNIIAAALLALSLNTPPDDFAIIKSRVLGELMKTAIDDKTVEGILGRMQADGSFQDIRYDDLSRNAGFPHRRHTDNLVYMAKAYKSRKSKFYKSKVLKSKIIASLK